jgi:uroporphyrin-III C-methyltransferase / precorrin-2 dehydrogenase / sirohydrochlorin ferrochelatase
MRSLPLFHRISGQPVVVLGDGEAADAKRRLVERAGGVPVGEGDAQARLAFVAMDRPEAAAARLKASGLLVNVTDRPELCDFTVPSLLDRDPVIVAVGTSGASAGMAKQLRLRLEGILPQRLGALAAALESARAAIRERWPDGGDRRRALDEALREGGALDPLNEGAAGNLARWLEVAEDPPRAAMIEFHLSSDDPEDLTLRQARLLGEADAVLFEAPEPEAVLARSRADALRLALPAQDPVPDGLTVVLRRT